MVCKALQRWPAVSAVLLLLSGTRCLAADRVDISLTFPNGPSPKVFTKGWTFGAKATLNPGTRGAKDLSKQVRWSGTGTFTPAVGAVSHPVFTAPGANKIALAVKVGDKTYSKSFNVEAVTPNHAVVGWVAACPADAHGCPGCPHPVEGHIKTGNAKVKINGKPVACVGNGGTHDIRPCCGPNHFTIIEGDPNVRVDGKPVAKKGSRTQHCGGVGVVGGTAGKPVVTRAVYKGTFTGGAAGTANFTIGPGGITGTFVGRHTTEGGGSVKVQLKGVYVMEPRVALYRAQKLKIEPHMVTGTVGGDMKGTSTYKGIDGKKATATVRGKFKGLTKHAGTLTGTWRATAEGLSTVNASGTFKATLAK